MSAQSPQSITQLPVGLIAGNGKLPQLTAEGIRAAGRPVACVGLADQVDPGLSSICDHYNEAGMIRLGRWIRLLKRWGCQEAIMVGGVQKSAMYTPGKLYRQLPDWRVIYLWYRKLRHDRRDHAVLTAVADELAIHGIQLIDSTTYMTEHLAPAGQLTKRSPTAEQQADIAFAWPMLLQLSDLDIGQALAVKDRDIIAVEAIEGTSRMIERAGELCRTPGWTLLKGASDQKDMRFDVPTIGIETLEKLHAAGGRCIAIAGGRVLLADKPEVLVKADALGIAIVGV